MLFSDTAQYDMNPIDFVFKYIYEITNILISAPSLKQLCAIAELRCTQYYRVQDIKF